MDIISHSAAGAATGAIFGRPFLGALCGILPDLVLGVKRLEKPSNGYIRTHSLLFALWVWAMLYVFAGKNAAMCGGLAVISHLALDIPTHGKDWAPRLFYPVWEDSISLSRHGEWEWFNDAWLEGLAITFVWVLVCLSLTFG